MRLKRASAQKSGIQEKIGKKGTQQRREAALVTGCRHKQPEGLNWFLYLLHKKATTIKTNGRVAKLYMKIANKKRSIRHIRKETFLWK